MCQLHSWHAYCRFAPWVAHAGLRTELFILDGNALDVFANPFMMFLLGARDPVVERGDYPSALPGHVSDPGA